MKISFDFDNTLEKENIQKIAQSYINAGDKVFIITRRCQEDAQEVYSVADKLGISYDDVYFTCHEWKWRTIKDLQIDEHYDDKLIEVLLIQRHTKTNAILIQ
jgi:hypothetical protein